MSEANRERGWDGGGGREVRPDEEGSDERKRRC